MLNVILSRPKDDRTPLSPPISSRPNKNKYADLLRVVALAIALGIATRAYLEQNRSDDFAKFGLVHKERISATASIFYLAQKDSSRNNYQDAWAKGIWNLELKQPQIQVVRAYTPLPPRSTAPGDGTPEHQLRFLVRNEEHGEVSSWLHRLPVGSELELRGPKLERTFPPDTTRALVLAGGTGIATALQTAHVLLARPADSKDLPRVSILWANRSQDECVGATAREARGSTATSKKSPIIAELEALQAAHPEQLTIKYYVDAEKTFIDKAAVESAVAELEKHGPISSPNQVIVSGPEGFIKYLAGPKQWRNGVHEQGPLDGVVAQVFQHRPHAIEYWKG